MSIKEEDYGYYRFVFPAPEQQEGASPPQYDPIAIVLIILAAATLFPICYMILSSFGPNVSTAGNMRTILPSRFTLESFDAFFHFSDYSLRWILNSVVVATGAVIGNVIFASMAGYAFAKIRFKGSKILFGLILVAMMIPYQVTQVPLYILMVQKFSMTNTYAAMILPGLCTAYNIFLCKQFFSGLPTPLIESAKIEGCNQFQIFVKIVLPLGQNRAGGYGESTPSWPAGTTSSGRSW